jgi:hypothetical protein
MVEKLPPLNHLAKLLIKAASNRLTNTQLATYSIFHY